MASFPALVVNSHPSQTPNGLDVMPVQGVQQVKKRAYLENCSPGYFVCSSFGFLKEILLFAKMGSHLFCDLSIVAFQGGSQQPVNLSFFWNLYTHMYVHYIVNQKIHLTLSDYACDFTITLGEAIFSVSTIYCHLVCFNLEGNLLSLRFIHIFLPIYMSTCLSI